MTIGTYKLALRNFPKGRFPVIAFDQVAHRGGFVREVVEIHNVMRK